VLHQRFKVVPVAFDQLSRLYTTDPGVNHVAGLRCHGCDGKGSLDFKLGGPPSDMADVAIQRRIERIVYTRRIVWKDNRGV
jgi:hypothetical protein